MTDVLPVVTGVAGLVTGAAGTWVAVSTMRERRQPVVIAHEDQSRSMSSGSGSWHVVAHITNESGPTAFNVRFGVEYSGVRFPYRMAVNHPESGNVQRVVQAGARLPANERDGLPILISSQDLWHTAAVSGPLDDTAVYWCRYENALGQTWETRNPADRSSKLDICRVRRPEAVERREIARRDEMRTAGQEWEAAALEELRSRQPPEVSG